MKILVVDDTKLSRAMILKRIPGAIKKTASITQAVNGQEAVDFYKQVNPDNVFLDLTMPVMDGFEALKLIKEYDENAFVYIITADIQEKAKERVLADGAAGIENKPISEQRLEEILSLVQKD
jgi:two-component system chemotaxis response regulator CheY